MAKLTKKQTLHVSKLAKLTLSDTEINKFTEQLAKVIHLMDELNSVDTKDIEPMAQATDLLNVMRGDEIDTTRILSQDEALSNTENIKNGFIVVPQILNK